MSFLSERTKGYIILKKILYLTDLSYKAKGRNYSEEDIYITDKLKNKYDVVLCHPKCAVSYEDYADIVVFRNTGSVIGYKDIYFDFLKRVSEKKLKTFNSFDGKADMKGKQYLLELTAEKYPVIPTVDSVDDISILPKSDLYVIKPKDGADSIGLDFVTLEEINGHNICHGTMLIQPAIRRFKPISFDFRGGRKNKI
jgi:glutathione synthase/RimK-type ligase-like ATP-grasp enzyme